MRIGTKIAFSQLVMGALIVAAMYMAAYWVWAPEYERWEERQAADKEKWTQHLWAAEEKRLALTVADWAPWDELYDFAQQPSERKFARDNLSDDAMSNLRVDWVLILDPAYKICYSRSLLGEWEEKELLRFEADWQRQLANSPELQEQLRQGENVKGLAILNGRPVLVAAQQILHSDKRGPSVGFLVMIQLVDADLLKEFSQMLQASLVLEQEEELQARYGQAVGTWSEEKDEKLIRAYWPLGDIFGQKGILLRLDLPRYLYQEMQHQYQYFFMLSIAVLIMSLFVSVYGLDVLLTRRLRRLGDFLADIRNVGTGERPKLPSGGNDELARIARKIEEMLARLREDHFQIDTLNQALQGELKERQKAEELMQYHCWHDALTGLYNRTFLEMVLNKYAQSGVKGFGIICGDLDGLKIVNDTLGHEAGDTLLRRTADLFREILPETAITVRTGGDEFVSLLVDIQEEELWNWYQQLQTEAQKQDGGQMPLQISFGCRYQACCVPGGDELHNVLREADDSMYRQKNFRKQSTRSVVIQALLKMIELHESVTNGHSQRLKALAEKLAREMALEEEAIEKVVLLAQFREIGRIGLPEPLLTKEEPLTEAERQEIQRHAEIGYRIALVIPELEGIAELIRTHHEWWNGKGYPRGLKGEEIPLESRIVAIVDAYDAMTNYSVYREAQEEEQVELELRRGRGLQFDPELLEVFLEKMLGEEKQPQE
nr:HD domain-containing phosphohydrolase [uncultured Anaeromusa sp.]